MDGTTTNTRLTANPDSDVTPAASSGKSYGNSDYVESFEKLLMRFAKTLELEFHILEVQHMHECS